jgi:hypothetical protein
MKIIEDAEKWISGQVNRAINTGEAEPLEIADAICEKLEDELDPVSRRSPMPAGVIVHLTARDEQRRAMFERSFIRRGKLEKRIRSRMAEIGCALPPSLRIQIVLGDQLLPEGESVEYKIEYQEAEPRKPVEASPICARISVTKGRAREQVYEFNMDSNYLQIRIGRDPEVTDRDGKVIRRNDVIFESVDDRVSRQQAHIEFDPRAGNFRIFDDESSYGTYIFRNGRRIDVSTDDPRGIRLKDGDEVFFGRACVKFEIDSAEMRR